MIPQNQKRSVVSNFEGDSVQFGISQANEAHIMRILREKMYNDPIKAVLREYATNGWDEHRDAGKPNLPIKVTLPTYEEPTLRIRDFGRGLSPEGIRRVYSQYGASTKRSSNETVGMLGIGSKSAFAYTDSFTITSWHGGTLYVYNAALDESDKGSITLMHEEPCGDETGVEICVPVKPNDIWVFEQKAKELYQFFEPRPQINTDLPEATDGQRLTSGIVWDYKNGAHGWLALMGCIPYHIDLNQLGNIPDYLHQIRGVVFCNIGEVNIGANREELAYDSSTKKVIVQKLNDLVDEYVKKFLADLKTSGGNRWEQRLRAQSLHWMNVPVPAEAQGLLSPYLSVKGKLPLGVNIYHGRRKDEASSIPIDRLTKICYRDENRALAGYSLTDRDVVVRRNDRKLSWSVIKAEFEKLIKELDIEGIPVCTLSSLAWTQPARGYGMGKVDNPKHRMKVFKYTGKSHRYGGVKSDLWDSVDHVPTDSDVYVILQNFEPMDDMFNRYREDALFAQMFGGGPLPEVIGYKHTAKKPVLASQLKGQSYAQWSDNFRKSLLKDDVLKLYETLAWADGFEQIGYYNETAVQVHARCLQHLGEYHDLTQYLKKVMEARTTLDAEERLRDALRRFRSYAATRLHAKPEAQKVMSSLLKKYPLFAVAQGGMRQVLSEQYCKLWFDYIKLIDSQ